MSAYSILHRNWHVASERRDPSRLLANARAVVALAWAAALIIAIGGNEPAKTADSSAGVAALIASYPLIDVVASIAGASFERSSRNILWINAAISAAGVIAIAVTAFSSDAQATMISFGAWAAVSGAILFGTAIYRRRSTGGQQLPLIVSGGLSTIAGLGFIAISGSHNAHLVNLAGYMAFGALLYLLWAFRGRGHRPSGR
jgi:hypothetical protein